MNTPPETTFLSLCNRFAACRGSNAWKILAIVSVVAACNVRPAHAQNTVDSFTNALGDGNYNEAGNWSTGTVPNLTTTQTAQIADGAAVTYNPGGDLVIKNGGELEITSGSFTQNTANNNYLQLNGNATVLVDGGTFNQGGISSGPFNTNGTTGNVFTVSGGAANLNHGYAAPAGLTTTISGGTVTVTGGDANIASSFTVSGGTANLNGGNTNINSGGVFTASGGSVAVSSAVNVNFGGSFSLANATVNVNGGHFSTSGTFAMSSGALTLATSEFDFNSDTNTLSGGTIMTPLITGVNGNGTGNGLNADGTSIHTFSISGGTLQLTGSGFGSGIYGGGTTQYINFTSNSSGDMVFASGVSQATIQGLIQNNVIEYSNTPYSSGTGFSEFSFSMNSAGDEVLSLAGASMVPEPATVLAGLLMAGATVPLGLRQLRRRAG